MSINMPAVLTSLTKFHILWRAQTQGNYSSGFSLILHTEFIQMENYTCPTQEGYCDNCNSTEIMALQNQSYAQFTAV